MSVRADWSRYFTPSASARHLGLFCLGVGWQQGLAVPMRGRILDCYAAVLIRSGQGHLSWATHSSTEKVHGPSLFWLFPGVAHTYAPTRPGWSEQWVLFNGFGANSYEDLGYLQRDRPLVNLDSRSALGSVVDVFEKIIAEGSTTGPHVDVAVAALIHQLITAVPRPGRDREPVDRASELTNRLLADACTPMSMAEHAKRLGVSLATLRESVRSVSSESPKELVLTSRLTHAKDLLAQTDLSISQIARSVGYDDPAYFSRLFTGRVGMPPRAFRHQQARRDH